MASACSGLGRRRCSGVPSEPVYNMGRLLDGVSSAFHPFDLPVAALSAVTTHSPTSLVGHSNLPLVEMRPTLTINTNLGTVILENQVAMMDDLIFPDTSITALTAHHQMVNTVHVDQHLVLNGDGRRQVHQDGYAMTICSATESQVDSLDTVIPSPPTPTPTATATHRDSERDEWSSLDAMSKEEISDDYVVVDQNTTGTAVTDDLVSKTNIAAALFKTVAVAAEQYSALKGLAAKYFVR